MNFLDKVTPVKEKEIQLLKKSLDDNRFACLFQSSKQKTIFIAEVKPRSPSAGQLISGDPLALVDAYEKGGANAISVLTDAQFFGGSPELFAKIRKRTSLPLLRKEFIVDESQLVESLVLGADAVLLIAQLVTPQKLKALIHFSKKIGLVPLVEIIDESELKTTIDSGAKYIGVNSRDLRTMKVDSQKALVVLSKIPSSIHKFLFSGIERIDQVEAAVQAGANGFLIGTSLIRANHPAAKLQALRAVSGEEYVS